MLKNIIWIGAGVMVKLNDFSRLKNIFSRLNPIPRFRWKNHEEEIVTPPSSKQLLEYSIKKYPKFKNVILIAIYHLLNVKDQNIEHLTVLSKEFKLIADLVEGKYGEVPIPDNVKSEAKKENIFITCHNHYYGAVIPSWSDFKNSICPNIPFTIIVSEGNISILVNEFNNLDESALKSLKIDLKDYIEYVRFSFIVNNECEIHRLYELNLMEWEYKREYQILFDRYVARSNLKFVNEFNLRMEKYNLYMIYINV